MLVSGMHEWITELLTRSGYLGVTLLMFAENLFPPIPSELIMPLAGFFAARGTLTLPLVVAAGALGSVLGALPWYVLGRWLGEGRLERWAAKHGRWLTLGPSDLKRAQKAFERHCGKAVLVGRLVPAVRTLISVPAGVARMPLGRFLLFTAAGSVVWAGTLAVAGHALGQEYDAVARYMGPVSNAIIGVLLLVYVYRVIRWKST